MNVLLGLLLLLPFQALAGGDGENAIVRRLVIDGKKFAFVLVPEKADRFSILGRGNCKVFSVFGSFDRAKWGQNHTRGPDLASHKKALDFLREASKTGAVISFGYMGTGYRAFDEANPCVVESNGLSAFESPEHKFRAVTSYYE